jgi:hypothetical protein
MVAEDGEFIELPDEGWATIPDVDRLGESIHYECSGLVSRT